MDSVNELVDPNVSGISASDWCKGILLSLAASLIAGASKLAIKKSWLILQEQQEQAVLTSHNTTDPLNLQHRGGESLLLPSSATDAMTADETASATLNSSVDEDDENAHCRESFLYNPYFLRYFGMVGMSILNPICSVFAMNYASPSILAPFSGLTLVWVNLFSGVTVGEHPSSAEIMAAVFIMLGEIVVCIFGDHTSDDGVTVEQVADSYKEPSTIYYFVGLTFYMGLLGYWAKFSQNPALKRFAWGSAGGTITGPQNFLKDSLTILKAVTSSDGAQHFPCFFPVLVIFAILTALSGLLLLTACMKRYDATYSAAAFVGSFVMSASINAALHYHTFASLPSAWNDVLYPFGLVILLFGVFILENNTTTVDLEEDNEVNGIIIVEEDDGLLPNGEVNRDRKDSEDSQTPFAYTQVVEPQVEIVPQEP